MTGERGGVRAKNENGRRLARPRPSIDSLSNASQKRVGEKRFCEASLTIAAICTTDYSYLTELTVMVRLSLAVVTTPVTVPALGSLQISL